MVLLEGIPASDLIPLTCEVPYDLSPAVLDYDVLLLALERGEPVIDEGFDVLEPELDRVFGVWLSLRLRQLNLHGRHNPRTQCLPVASSCLLWLLHDSSRWVCFLEEGLQFCPVPIFRLLLFQQNRCFLLLLHNFFHPLFLLFLEESRLLLRLLFLLDFELLFFAFALLLQLSLLQVLLSELLSFLFESFFFLSLELSHLSFLFCQLLLLLKLLQLFLPLLVFQLLLLSQLLLF